MQSPFTLLAVTLSLTLLTGASAKEGAPDRRDPKDLGRVVLLPFLDITGARGEKRDEYRETAVDEVEERFKKHEIAFVTREELAKALALLKMAPSDEEDRTKPRLKVLADHLKAQWVVTGT